jgi:hypothetical protein
MIFLKLAQKNKEVDPQSWERLYETEIVRRIRKRYNQNQVEAIVNNYLAEPTNEKYAAEFKAFQEYRTQCKTEVKRELGIE